MVRSMGRAGREVDEERLVGNQRFLLPDPVDRLIRHVFHQVIAFFRLFLTSMGEVPSYSEGYHRFASPPMNP